MKIQRLAWLLIVLAGCRGQHQGPGEIKGAAVPAPVIAARQAAQTSALQALAPGAPAGQADPLRRSARAHHLLARRVHAQPAVPQRRGHASAGRRLRLRALLQRPRLLEHQRPRRRRLAAALAGDQGGDPPVQRRRRRSEESRHRSPSSAGSGPRSARRRRTTTGTRTSSSSETDEDKVPKRPISALSAQLVGALRSSPPLWQRLQLPLFDFANRQRYFDVAKYQQELRDTPLCPEGVDTRQLPEDCHESAQTPDVLFEKLSQWGFDTIVIPARHHLGPLHAARQRLGQAAGRRHARSRQADADRGLLRPRQLGGVPQLARGGVRRQRRADLPGAERRLPALLLAGRRDHPRPLRRHAGRRVRAAGRDGAPQLSRRRGRRASHRAGQHDRRLEGLRPVPRLLQSGLQLAPAELGTVHQRHRQLRRPGRAAPLPLRLHRLERQPHRAAGHRLQGVRAADVHRDRRAAATPPGRDRMFPQDTRKRRRVGAVRPQRRCTASRASRSSTSSARRRSS